MRKGKIAKQWDNGIGYRAIGITIKGRSKNLYVHRLVLQTFVPHDKYDEMEVNHKDGDKSNNELENLEWVTSEENIKHAWESGLIERRTPKTKESRECGVCGEIFVCDKVSSKYCSIECKALGMRKVQSRPSKEDLYITLKEKSFEGVGRDYGVSGNTIRKWCKDYGIPYLAPYYRKYK